MISFSFARRVRPVIWEEDQDCFGPAEPVDLAARVEADEARAAAEMC